MERNPNTVSNLAPHPPPVWRVRVQKFCMLSAGMLCLHLLLGSIWFGLLSSGRLHGQTLQGQAQGVEIGVPLSDPKFPVAIFAHSGIKSQRGSATVYQLNGGCRIYQGAFVAQSETATVWVQTEEVEGETSYRLILETEGSCDVRWNEDQRLQDNRWMGRLFTKHELEVSVQVWKESTQPAPAIDWSRENRRSTSSTVSNGSEDRTVASGSVDRMGADPAVAWSKEDEASYLRLASQLQEGVAPPGSQQLPNSMQVGNSSLGGTVLDAGSMQLFESVAPGPSGTATTPPANSSPANSSPANALPANALPAADGTPPVRSVESFQLPPPAAPAVPLIIDSGPAPIAAPVAASTPNVKSGQKIGARTFMFTGRGGVEPKIQINNRPERGDSVVTISRGIRLRFGDAAVQTSGGLFDVGTILIEADRCVIWTSDMNKLLSRRIDDLPVELYLEGNIVFQQGARRIFADRMYYNVQSEYGMILGAEVLTPAPQYEGIVRLKADVIQQRSRENLLANRAALTSSRLGVPRYWLQSDRIELNDQRESVNTGMLGFGILAPSGDQTAMKAKARSNFVYVEGVPVFYWPVLNSNVESPSFYVSGFQTRQDTLFGTVAMVDWDLYQILGINALDGTRWGLSTDYLSKRGFAMGTNYNYNLPSLLGAGPTYGWLDAWGLSDRGLDTLGSDRKDMVPEATRRAKVFLQHRQLLTPDQELWAEVGYITDRNFLEQYFENEWDTWKDRATALRYRHYFAEQQMLDFWGAVRTNAFFTETEWLPRADHYWLGKDVANVMTWYSHSQVGYAKLQKASFPTAPEDAAKWIYQPWEVPSSGIQAITRQELAMPVDLKYSKLTPYIAGEAAYWGEDLNGDSLGRLTGQAGVRSSTPFWNVFPDVQSSLLNLNGLAHKVSIEADTWYADSSKNLDQLPLYDPIDDNSQEHFRRRLIINTFGGTLPAQFESNNFAARQGMQRYVSAASSIIVADQMQSRMGLHQRWQTKRGVPGRERIADVVEFDVDGIYFYNPDRDNFGQTVGGINYAFRYHIGDRVTLLSDGYYDLFESGLHATTLGGSISRPGRGDMYLGFTTLDGPMTSDLLTAAFNYRLNDKWAAYGGTSYDFNVSGNRGQAIGITRIGESFLLRLGVNYDLSRDNTSFQFALEPRFLPSRGLGVIGGQVIPPAGAYGLE